MIGHTLAGRYHILSELGQGAFGQTYLAEDTKLPDHKRCVVKHLKPRNTDELTLQEAKRLFSREAKILNKLGEHRQIPRLFAHFEENGEFYLVQEFIEGKDLRQEIFVGKKLPESEVVQILDQVLDILAFVHQQNAIHRDIKPSNIMRRDEDKKLVLIDFGAVKELTTQVFDNRGLTTLTVAIRTNGYMPSEQSNSRPKFASDLYALGVMAIFALTGIEPNSIRKNPETEEFIWRDQNKVSADLGDFIDRLVKYNFRDRFSSAVEAKEALRKIIKIPPVTPEPTGDPKFPIVKKIIAATALLLAVGGGYFYWNKLQEPTVSLLTYEDTDYAMEVDYPDNWELNKIEDPFGTIVRFYAENGEGLLLPAQVTIEVENIDSNVSLDEYTTSNISKIIEYLQLAKIISSQPITLGTRSAHKVIYTGRIDSEPVEPKYLQVWFLEGNRAYIFTYCAPSNRYQDFVGTVENMMIPSWEVGEILN